MPAQQTFSPSVAFASTSSAEPSASPSTSSAAPLSGSLSTPSQSFQQPQPPQANGAGFSGPGPYNQYHPQHPQQFNHHPSQHQHQPYYRNQPGFRPPHHQQNHQHHPHHQQQHQPQGQFQHQEPTPHPHSQGPPPQHPNSVPQHPTPTFQHRYPDPALQQGYNGWTGGGGPYYPSPNQPYPQMGGPGPATMQNQNGYGYMDQYGRQGYGGMYGMGYDGRAEGEAQPEGEQMPNFQPGPGPNGQSADYPYPPPLPNASSNQSPHPHPASIPPSNGQSGPCQPPYFPPNHPYNMGNGMGMGYPPYPLQNYGGYSYDNNFMPPPLPNGVNLPPQQHNPAPLIPQSNGPTRTLNPAAQGFKFVPSNQPPPPVSAPPPDIAAPPPPAASAPSTATALAPAPVFASIRRNSTPKGIAQTLKEQKFVPPVLVDGEKLKGIGGKRRDSEDGYEEPTAGPALAIGDVLGLSEPQPSQPQPSVVDSTPAMSTSGTTPTSPQSIKTPRAAESDPTPLPSPPPKPLVSAPAPSAVPVAAASTPATYQFVGPTMSGFMSPPSAHQPSLAQAMDTIKSAQTSRTTSGAGSSRKPKPVMDGPIIFTSTRPIASQRGENTFKSVASLLPAGETKGWKKGKGRAQGKRAVWGVGEGVRAGKRVERGQKGKIVFGEIEEEVEKAQKVESKEDKPVKKLEAPAVIEEKAPVAASAPEPTPSTVHTSAPAPAPATSTPPPASAPSPTPAPAAAAPTTPAAPAPRKPATWAALVGSRPTTSAPSLASTTATPSASTAPSKLPSPTKPSSALPSTPEISLSETLSGAKFPTPSTPASASAGPSTGKRPTFNYAAAAAAGAALSPADELVKLLSEGLGNRAGQGAGKGTVPRGLINTGNMCFINTILQTLAYCPPFTDLLETLGQRLKADLGRKTPLLEAVIVFLRELQPSPVGPVANGNGNGGMSGTSTPRGPPKGRGVGGKDAFVPENVYEAMKENKRFDSMRRGFQEDAEEYLGFFLNTLHEELLFLLSRTHTRSTPPNGTSDPREHSIERPVSPSSDSPAAWLEVGKKQRTHVVRSNESRESAITRIFGGTLRSILHTPGVKDSITLEPYQPLQLDISDSSTRSVVDALKHLSTPEIVQTWSAAKKANVDATKTVFVETWPGVLICHLKRFVYDAEEREVVKKSRAVAYGTELVVPNEIISPSKRSSVPVKYRLFGVVYHHGSTASGGHYTVAVSREQQQWIHFDDETVSTVPVDSVIVSPEEAEVGKAGLIGGREKCAYLLFYQRIKG